MYPRRGEIWEDFNYMNFECGGIVNEIEVDQYTFETSDTITARNRLHHCFRLPRTTFWVNFIIILFSGNFIEIQLIQRKAFSQIESVKSFSILQCKLKMICERNLWLLLTNLIPLQTFFDKNNGPSLLCRHESSGKGLVHSLTIQFGVAHIIQRPLLGFVCTHFIYYSANMSIARFLGLLLKGYIFCG